jgi:outer membrane protein assembly factor BamB
MQLCGEANASHSKIVRSGRWWLLVVGIGACSHERLVDPQFGRPATVIWRAEGSAAGRVSQDQLRAFFPGDRNELVAVNKSTGQIAWRSQTRQDGTGTLGFGTAVTGSFVVMVDLYLYAFDRETGLPGWRFEAEIGVNLANSTPTANDSVVFIGSGAGIVWALDGKTGSVIWRRPPPVSYPALAVHPVFAGDLVLVGYTEPAAGNRGALGALDAATGEVRWVHDFLSYVDAGQDAGCYGDVAVTETSVYSSIGRGDVLALDRSTGQLQWRAPASSNLPGTERRPAAVVRGVLVVGSTRGHLTGFDPATGDTLWHRQLSNGSINEPFAHDDLMVYLTVGGGHVAAIDARSGEVRWSNGLRSDERSLGLFGPGAVDGQHLYIGGSGGLFAFQK